MSKAVERAGSPSFNEEGGFFGMTSEGKEYVVHAKSGEKSDPAKGENASINVFMPNDISTIPDDANPTIVGTFHTHPGGTVTEGNMNSFFHNPPSNVDVSNAATNRRGITGNSYVLAQGNSTVYIYNGNGTKATFPFQQFFLIGIKK